MIICQNLELLYFTGNTETFPLSKAVSESSSPPSLTDDLAEFYNFELSDARETY